MVIKLKISDEGINERLWRLGGVYKNFAVKQIDLGIFNNSFLIIIDKIL